jgi:hypothetical protein
MVMMVMIDDDDGGEEYNDVADDDDNDYDKVFHNVLAETNKYREVANMIPYLDRTNYQLR